VRFCGVLREARARLMRLHHAIMFRYHVDDAAQNEACSEAGKEMNSQSAKK